MKTVVKRMVILSINSKETRYELLASSIEAAEELEAFMQADAEFQAAECQLVPGVKISARETRRS